MSNHKPRGSLNSPEALPVTPAEVTAEWCSRVLGRQIKEIAVVDIIYGTADKLFLELTETEETAAGGAPKAQQRLCLKGGFNPQLIALHPSITGIYRREAEFYYHVAPHVGMRLPKAWYCGSDTVSGQGIVITDDLAVEGCTFGTPTAVWPVERVRAAVEQLAALHAKTWNATSERFPWLSGAPENNAMRSMILSLMTPVTWDALYGEGVERPPVPDHMADRERLIAAFMTLWRTTDPQFSCAIHGDPHIGNTFITAAGDPGFIDWQCLHIGSPFHDVSYFITGALTIEDRRQHEESLATHYLATLARLGGPELRRADIWDEYRKHVMHGMAWALTLPQMQPRENIVAMTERYATAVEDHRSLELLESLPEYRKAS